MPERPTVTVSRPAERRYWEAVAAGDGARAVSTAVSLFESGTSLADITDRLVCKSQAEVGRLWAANKWNVAQEHRATSISEEVVAALASRVSPAPRKGTAVMSCIDGEWHSLPSRVVCAVLREAGWEVHFLGACVPVSHLAHFLQDAGPDVTALSCSLPTGLPRARRMIEASREAGIPVLAGGLGFGPGGRWALRLGANATAPDARTARDVLEAPDWPSFTGPAPAWRVEGLYGELVSNQSELVMDAARRLEARWPEGGEHDERHQTRTEEGLGQLLDFLAAAIYVADTGLYTDFLEWMAAVLEARHVPAEALIAHLVVTEEAIHDLLGDRPTVRETMAAGREAVLAGT